MQNPFRIAFTVLVIAIFATAGCRSTPTITGDHGITDREAAIVPSLVTVDDGATMAGLAAGWETGRNDQPTCPRLTPDHAGTTFVEIRHFEHLRTSSGRPREHSTTRTRTIHRVGRRR